MRDLDCEVLGADVAVGEEDSVFVVAAHTGSAHVSCQVDDAGGVGAFGDEVADEDEVVVSRAELDFIEE